MTSNNAVVKFICSALCALLIFGCSDGGTSGTGIRGITGSVYLSDNSPAKQSEVAVLETGEISTTDNNGQFSIDAHISNLKDISLQITHSSGAASVQLNDIPANSEDLVVDVTIDPIKHTGQARLIDISDIAEFDLGIQIIGACESYFTDSIDDTIKQIRKLPNHSPCLLRAVVHGDNELIGGVQVGIERRLCGTSTNWHKISSGLTSTRAHQGTVVISTPFDDDANFCEYKISAPYRDQHGRARYARIVPLAGQN